jgi:hypothetical protein
LAARLPGCRLDRAALRLRRQVLLVGMVVALVSLLLIENVPQITRCGSVCCLQCFEFVCSYLTRLAARAASIKEHVVACHAEHFSLVDFAVWLKVHRAS